MSRAAAPAGRVLVTVLAAVGVALGGCGGAQQDHASEARTYAERVAAISTRTGDRLARLSDSADYTKAEAAARSTRAYAAAIQQAADELSRATAPESVAGLQRALVALYRHTAGSLDRIAREFAGDADPVALAATAQRLSSEVQRYSSREQQLRGAIQRALAEATTPAPRPK